MTPAQSAILKKFRAGEPVTREDQLATISSKDELDAFQQSLIGRGALTGSLLLAIETRRAELT